MIRRGLIPHFVRLMQAIFLLAAYYASGTLQRKAVCLSNHSGWLEMEQQVTN